jgi:hypothetical protein
MTTSLLSRLLIVAALLITSVLSSAGEDNDFKNRQVDQVDIGSGGNPLPPPSLTSHSGDQGAHLRELCEKLKALNQNPGYCN